MTNVHRTGMAFAVCLLAVSVAGAQSAAGQASLMPDTPEKGLWLEATRPDIEDPMEMTLASGAWLVSGRYPLTARLWGEAEIPFAFGRLDVQGFEEDNGSGNPYVEVEYSYSTSDQVMVEVAVRAPLTTADDQRSGDVVGFLAYPPFGTYPMAMARFGAGASGRWDLMEDEGHGSDLGVGVGLVMLPSFGVPGPAAAEIGTIVESRGGARWTVIDAVGYGGLGFGLGLLASQMQGKSPRPIQISDPDPPGLAISIAGRPDASLAYDFSVGGGWGVDPPWTDWAIVGGITAAGTVAGWVIGRRADKAVAEGRPLGGAHRVAVLGGGVMAGGTVAAAAAAALIMSQDEGTFLGSDELTASLLVSTGSALGALYVWKHRQELPSSRIRFAPEISEGGGYGLRGRVVF